MEGVSERQLPTSAVTHSAKQLLKSEENKSEDNLPKVALLDNEESDVEYEEVSKRVMIDTKLKS
jgi:hypothetical protein